MPGGQAPTVLAVETHGGPDSGEALPGGSIPTSMIREQHDLLTRHPACLLALTAYWNTQLQLKKEVAEFDGWVVRMTSIPDIPPEALSGVHGKLIAFGYLKFELTPRDTTLRYQLTPLGRNAVTGEASLEPGESSADAEWALSA